MAITIENKWGIPPTELETEIIDYYINAGPDYAYWSKKFNMHFGYYKKGMNPFRLEPMLDQMSEEVFTNLNLDTNAKHYLYDLGCGLGTTTRHIAQHNKNITLTGISIVPWQIEEAKKRTKQANLESQVNYSLADYRNIAIEDNSIDGAYAIESACHCPGQSKKAFVNEMARILKPGKNFVIIDGFLQQQENRMPKYLKKKYNRMCIGWAVPELAQLNNFEQELESAGLANIKVKNLFWNVAPSALFIPKTLFKFLFALLKNKKPVTREQWKNAEASFMGMLLGMHQKYFGYYKITGTKI